MNKTGQESPRVNERLIMFLKNPLEGKVKTRLIPHLGAAGAATLQREMAIYIAGWMRAAALCRVARASIYHAGGSRAEMGRLLGEHFDFQPQAEGHLGVRLLRAFEESFARGDERVLIIGADCPTLRAGVLIRALDHLAERDVVIVPASDGGYCLIGMRRLVPQLLEGIPWGTGEVLAKSVEILKRDDIPYALLETHRDVDTPEDLMVWQEAYENYPVPKSNS